MKTLLLVPFLTLLFSLPVYGNMDKNCKNALSIVMENLWHNSSSSESIESAIKQCHEPATKEDMEAQYALSALYFLKNNKIENEKSYFWTKKAALNNHIDAQYRLGKIYETGKATPKDILKAEKWYTKSAENGLVLAQRKLGDDYTTVGRENLVFLKGLYWYEKAADQGDKLSIIKLMNIYTNGAQDFPINKEKADYWEKRYELIF